MRDSGIKQNGSGIVYYFAYGSNMSKNQMKDRLGKDDFKRERAKLKGYTLKFNKKADNSQNQGYANIVKDEGSIVEGILYELDEDGIKTLDEWEGVDSGHYNRIVVTVELDSGENVEAYTYIARPDKVKDGLKSTEEYLKLLLEGCDLLSEDYCNKLRSIECIKS